MVLNAVFNTAFFVLNKVYIALFMKQNKTKQILNKLIFSEIKIDLNKVKNIIKNERVNIDNLSNLGELDKLINFLIIAEDRRFYNHLGFDIIAIFRAIRNRMLYHKLEGASTIEQQLIRVLTNQYERTLYRKIKEIILATKLKRFLSKKEIALLYLKLAYYGTDKQGLESILSFYKLKFDDKISDNICASIIARLKYPEPKSDFSQKHILITRRTNHLMKLYQEKYGEYY